MRRVAAKPLNSGAVAAADAAIAREFPDKPSPGDPDYGAFQKIWMDAYVQNGGAVEKRSPKDDAAQADKARAKVSDAKGANRPVQPCPETKARPGPPPPPPHVKCPCTLEAVTVQCSHGGRTASGGLLQVVGDSVGGDKITATPNAKGACATKLVLRLQRFDGGGPAKTRGPQPQTRQTEEPDAEPGRFGWWNATPSVATVEATACGGNARLVRVERFPRGESKLKLNLSHMVEAATKGLAKLPFDKRLFTQKGTPRQIRRRGEAKDEDFTLEGLKKRFRNNASVNKDPEFVFQVACAWKEESGSHLVYCETAALLAADPLFEAGFSILLYGIPIPSLVKEYMAAGVYLNASGKIVLGGQVLAKVRPSPRRGCAWEDVRGTSSGELKLELAAELAALSPKVLQAKGAGAAAAKINGALVGDRRRKVWVENQWAVGELTASVVFKTLGGLIEYEREWKLFDGYTGVDQALVLDLS